MRAAKTRLEGGKMNQPVLAAERLDVYRVALQFAAFAAPCLSRVPAHLRDQLDRASASIVLNVAEGAGRRSGPDRARFFTIARGSATECAAVLDLLDARILVTEQAYQEGRTLLVRIVQMLSRLSANPGRG
jgi:four helix bundle protein